jgi:hypothetical protein
MKDSTFLLLHPHLNMQAHSLKPAGAQNMCRGPTASSVIVPDLPPPHSQTTAALIQGLGPLQAHR